MINIEGKKKNLAEQLQAISSLTSTKTKKVFFAAVGLALAGLCVVIMLLPFYQPFTPLIESAGKVSAPLIEQRTSTPLHDEELLLLVSFIKTMDSLKKFDQRTFTQIMKGREQLYDSVLYLISQSGKQLIRK